jgi:hypothetical protein
MKIDLMPKLLVVYSGPWASTDGLEKKMKLLEDKLKGWTVLAQTKQEINQ